MLFAAALTLTLQLERTSFDLLDGVSIEVVAHNSTAKPISEVFAKPAEYELTIEKRDGTVLWASNTQTPIGANIPPHMHAIMPGPNVLTVYIWNAIANDGSTPGPGDYTVRARLLGKTNQPQAKLDIHFISPTPVSALAKLKAGDELTVAGTLDATQQQLTDATGTVTLMKKIPLAGVVAIRGFIIERPDHTRVFYVKRWALMK
jgi:hypothetical protein